MIARAICTVVMGSSYPVSQREWCLSYFRASDQIDNLYKQSVAHTYIHRVYVYKDWREREREERREIDYFLAMR